MKFLAPLLKDAKPLCLAMGFCLGNASSFCALPSIVPSLMFVTALVLAPYFKVPSRRRIYRPEVPDRNKFIVLFFVGLFIGLAALLPLQKDLGSSQLGMPSEDVSRITILLQSDAARQAGSERFRVSGRAIESRDISGASASASAAVLAFVDDCGQLYAGARLVIDVDSIRPSSRGNASWILSGRTADIEKPRGAAGFRASVLSRIDEAIGKLGPGPAGFAMALLLGRQDELDEDMMRVFYDSGCAHLVALSGMHIALVASLVVTLSARFFGILVARLSGFAAAAAFIWLAGPFPSALRALAMFAVLQVFGILGRRVSAVSALCFSGPLVAAINPGATINLGFQLSFWALLGILLAADAISSALRPLARPVPAAELGTGLSAQVGTIPILLVHDLPVHAQALVAGVVLGPLVLAFMVLGVVALVLGLVAPSLVGPVVSSVADPLYRLILATGSFFS